MADVRTRLSEWVPEPTGSTPQEMRTLMQKDAQKWAPVITPAKISLEVPSFTSRPPQKVPAGLF
jgi:hypothetical protein